MTDLKELERAVQEAVRLRQRFEMYLAVLELCLDTISKLDYDLLIS